MAQGLDRITQQPEVMGGKACIRGTRIPFSQPRAIELNTLTLPPFAL